MNLLVGCETCGRFSGLREVLPSRPTHMHSKDPSPLSPSSGFLDGGRKTADAKSRKVRRNWVFAAVLLVVIAATAFTLFSEVEWSGLLRAMERLDPVLTVVLMALLPLVGFSVGVVYVIAGAKFGMLGGGLVIIGITMVHLVGTHWIGRSFLRKPIERFLTRRDYHLPDGLKGEERQLAAMVALVPGPPYVLRNYALALSGMPLRSYFWVCVLIYSVRSYVTLALGDLGTDISGRKLIWLGVIYAIKLAICGLLLRHIRHHYRERKAASQKSAPAPVK